MNLSHLVLNQLNEPTTKFYLEYLRAIDDKDIERFAAFLSDDVWLNLNEHAPVKGKEGVVEMLQEHWKSFDRLSHRPLVILGNDRHIAMEAYNDYRRVDGSDVTVRAAAFTALDEAGSVRDIRIYSDVSAVFGPWLAPVVTA